jgi:hypothetical protein
MKTIDLNCWALCKYDKWGYPVPITAPPVANINNLYHSFYIYNSTGVAIFYYRLSVSIAVLASVRHT